MQKTLIIWLFTAVIVVLFAVLNASPVPVNLLFTTVQLSLAFMIVLPLFLGAAAGYTLDLLSRSRGKKRAKELEKKLAAAETEIADLKRSIAANPANSALPSGSDAAVAQSGPG